MMKIASVLFLAALALPLHAQTPADPLAGIDFLVGHWASGDGVVADTGGTSKGSSVITREVGGRALLRRDHAELFDAHGKSTGGFDILMLIYPEDGTLHADYTDGQHVIHYTSAAIVPGKSVSFTSSAASGGPVFKLTYEFQPPSGIKITFGMFPPGQSAFRPIATGTMQKSR